MIKARGSGPPRSVYHNICTSYVSNAQGRFSSFALFFNRQKFLESLVDPAEPSPAPTPPVQVTWVAELKDAFLPLVSTLLANAKEDRAIDREAEDRRHKENIAANDRRHKENLVVREVERDADERRHSANLEVQRSVVVNQRLLNVLATTVLLAVGYCAFQVFLISQSGVAAQDVATARKLTGMCEAFKASIPIKFIGGILMGFWLFARELFGRLVRLLEAIRRPRTSPKPTHLPLPLPTR